MNNSVFKEFWQRFFAQFVSFIFGSIAFYYFNENGFTTFKGIPLYWTQYSFVKFALMYWIGSLILNIGMFFYQKRNELYNYFKIK
jgi:uncharacterized membrane protein HdeD (DUF308 family)